MAIKKPSDFHENVIVHKDETHDVYFYLLSERIADRNTATLNGMWLLHRGAGGLKQPPLMPLPS